MNTLQILTQQRIISIREFIKNLSNITDHPKDKVYTVVKNGERVGVFIPRKYEEEMFAERYFSPEPNEEKLYESLFDTYKDVAFTGGPKNISQHVDRYVYGAEDANE